MRRMTTAVTTLGFSNLHLHPTASVSAVASADTLSTEVECRQAGNGEQSMSAAPVTLQ